MKLWIAIVVLMFATVGHAGAAGGFYSGNTVLGWCEGEAVADKTMCMGYVAGIADITFTYDAWGDMDKEFCIPDNVMSDQLAKVVMKGLNAKPETLHHSAGGLVFNILNDVYPCD